MSTKSTNPFLALLDAARAMDFPEGDPSELYTKELQALSKALLPFAHIETKPLPDPPDVKLDTRPAREDLTSRECAKILGAMIGGFAMLPDANIDTLRQCVRMVADMSAPESASVLATPNEATIHTFHVMVATLSGLLQMADAADALIALRWWARNDKAWESLAAHRALMMSAIGERKPS